MQAMDYLRAKNWQQEVVFLCDSSWRLALQYESGMMYLNKDSIYKNLSQTKGQVELDRTLTQLDDFDIKQVSILGSLGWGRWLLPYFEGRNVDQVDTVEVGNHKSSSLGLMNKLLDHFKLDGGIGYIKKTKATQVYIDPYIENKISPQFMSWLDSAGSARLPDWLHIILRPEDKISLTKWDNHCVGPEEANCFIDEKAIFCFSDNSPYAQCSRSYPVALFSDQNLSCLFFKGDIAIKTKHDVDFWEIINILNYWRSHRMEELGLQWSNMGIDILTVTSIQNLLSWRDLCSYSSDHFHCRAILEQFGRVIDSPREIRRALFDIRRISSNESYTLNYSLQMMIFILERMINSTRSGERIFQRLGSDSHRIRIAESIYSYFYNKSPNASANESIRSYLSLMDFILKLDDANQSLHRAESLKESV